MNLSIEAMLQRYTTGSVEQKKNAMKEIIQEIVLCGLSRAGFFRQAAFYGGTALRIFYGLDRFSEDLDFSLKKPDPDFSLQEYFPVLAKEAAAYGLQVTVSEKQKTQESHIRSAFLKGNTKEHLLLFYADQELLKNIMPQEIIKVKFEVDVAPPPFASFEHRYQLLPAPYEIQLYDAPSLFAGKLHAVLCRSWKQRIKGRDLYDYIFYLTHKMQVNMPHLKARLVESQVLKEEDSFDKSVLKDLLSERFDTIDFKAAQQDVEPFIQDKSSLQLWSKEFFLQITERML